MNDQTLWGLMRDAWIRLEERFDPAIKPLVSKSKLTLREWVLILAALTFEPEDTTPSHLMVRGPYTSSDRYLAGLERAAEVGYLNQVREGRYQLSESGRTAVEEFINVARDALTSTAKLPAQELTNLASLFDKLIKECIETPPPPDSWSIGLSHKLMPHIDPPMPFIEQAISCLSAYRDDAHLASWCSSGLSASALESLSLIWRGQVNTFQELARKLEFRGHPDAVYLDALVELRERQYLEGSRNRLRITDAGKQFRSQVEQKTDQYFFHPWACLTAAEKDQIADILPKI
jgi:DNA-binding PadR family transcriptional regulator